MRYNSANNKLKGVGLMYCTHCGKEISHNSKYCPYCGNKLKDSALSPAWVYALSYIPVLFWLPLVVKPQTTLGKQIANQSLLLLLFGGGATIALNAAYRILQWSYAWAAVLWPITGLINLLLGVVQIGILVLIIIGIVHGASQKLFRLPVIGHIDLISK